MKLVVNATVGVSPKQRERPGGIPCCALTQAMAAKAVVAMSVNCLILSVAMDI